MREILFRGKRLEIGDWAEGSLITYPDGDCYIARPSDDPNVLDKFCVDPETVGQYTGLTDKNGKRIFEGDVVTFKRDNALGYTTNRIGIVLYYDELPIFYIMATTGDAWDWCQCEDIEVIGNIRDNPELIGGDEDG